MITGTNEQRREVIIKGLEEFLIDKREDAYHIHNPKDIASIIDDCLPSPEEEMNELFNQLSPLIIGFSYLKIAKAVEKSQEEFAANFVNATFWGLVDNSNARVRRF